MKLSGVKCIFLGVLIDAMVSLLHTSLVVILFAMGKNANEIVSKFDWLHAIITCVPLLFFWQSYKKLKCYNVYFMKSICFVIFLVVLTLLDKIDMPWAWFGSLSSTLIVIIDLMLFYHLFRGLSELAQKRKMSLLAKKLKRLFVIKLIIGPATLIVSLIVILSISYNSSAIVFFGLTILISDLLLYRHILKWLYRAQKELKA